MLHCLREWFCGHHERRHECRREHRHCCHPCFCCPRRPEPRPRRVCRCEVRCRMVEERREHHGCRCERREEREHGHGEHGGREHEHRCHFETTCERF